jgi:putative ABC transport system permease protein
MTQLFEGVGIALASLRANKGRAALTILGIAIGVMVVMVIAAMITGINHGISAQLESLGPRTFFVFREFQPGIHVDDGSRRRKRPPPLTVREAERLTTLPSVGLVGWGSANGGIRVEFAGRHINAVVFGRTANWLEFGGGDVLPGRSYTELEYRGNARVAVISDKLATDLFGRRDPVGKRVTIAGLPYDVIGVYNPPPQLFGQSSDPEVYMPYSTYQKYVETWRGWMEFLVSPSVTASQAQAVDDVIAAMRVMRGLKPAEDNNFAIVTQDKFMDAWNQLTGVFFLVMIALSSVGLLVGGVGVVAMMMISVTERTREIGVRKALGAKRREILWQFLVEAGTLTLVGGASGMVVGGLIALILSKATPVPAAVPVWSIVAALGASAVTGIGFGLYPAAKAARLDPVEALRYE